MFFVFLLPLLFTGCTHNDKRQAKEHAPKFYFDKAVQYKEKRNYTRVFDNLRKLRRHFFYSKYNEKALLLTADIYFAQDKYSQATQSYEKYLNLYPEKQKDYVLYQIGLSYKNQLPHRPDQDLSLATFALEAFDKLLSLKKTSPYKEKAKKEKQEILDKKASRELKAILFYRKQGWNQASFNKVKYFIKNYPKSPLMPKALLVGFQLARLLNYNSENFKKTLFEDYPNSKEIKSLYETKNTSIFSKWKQKLL